jgi:hypothetical protein|tara:strand:+ start:1490 stop:2233 length:744 start_codon:yes stop_codon:yes gene_type:complete
MMFLKGLFVFLLMPTLISCQFTETIVFNEDNSGKMSIEMDMGEMMAFGGETSDSIATKKDTLIFIKDILEEKKDSISKLPKVEQQKLRRMENYEMRMKIDSENDELLFNLAVNFKSIEKANGLLEGFSDSMSLMPNTGADLKFDVDDEVSSDAIAVDYSFKRSKFSRDAYINDEEKHKMQLDSLEGSESWLQNIKYTLKYTFPRKIVKSSIDDATYSLDAKTIEVTRNFVAYMKDPNILDLEIELEK